MGTLLSAKYHLESSYKHVNRKTPTCQTKHKMLMIDIPRKTKKRYKEKKPMPFKTAKQVFNFPTLGMQRDLLPLLVLPT